MKKVRVDKLAATVMEGLLEYADLATEDMKRNVSKAARTVRKRIRETAPRLSGEYSKSWSTRKTEESSTSITYTVHSRKRYRIAHLLEKGHAKRGGGRVKAFPHIAPAEEEGAEQLLRDIERDLKKGARNL